jgi:hypothetical protein
MSIYFEFISSTVFRISATIRKIRQFQNLPSGWYYGAGIAPSRETINIALGLVTKSINAGFNENNAFAGPDGEIQVTVYHGNTYLEFTVDPDLSIRFVRENGDTEVERVPDLSLDNALTRLEDFEIEVWRSLGSSTATTMTPERDVFRTLPSRPLDAERVFRSLSGTASSGTAPRFAST